MSSESRLSAPMMIVGLVWIFRRSTGQRNPKAAIGIKYCIACLAGPMMVETDKKIRTLTTNKRASDKPCHRKCRPSQSCTTAMPSRQIENGEERKDNADNRTNWAEPNTFWYP